MMTEAHAAPSSRRRPAATDPEAAADAAQASLAAAWAAGNLMVETYTAQVLQTRLSGGSPSCRPGWGACSTAIPSRPLGAGVAVGVQHGAGQHDLADSGPDRGPVRLGTARRPGRLVPPAQGPAPGRPAARFPRRCAARLDLALGGRLRHRARPGRRLRPPGGDPIPGQGPALAPGPPPRLQRVSRSVRGRTDPDRRAGHPGGATGRSGGAVHHRGRAPLGRVDGLDLVPARPAPPGRLPRPRRPRPRRRRPRGRPGLLAAREATSATCSTSRGCWTCTPS